MIRILHITLTLLVVFHTANCQLPAVPWHGKERSIHYRPAGKDFTTTNGTLRFNRALYGGNTAFRVEAGDLPEFALYLPGMGGNFKLGIISGRQSKWLIQAATIKATYRPGSMLYEVRDPLLGTGMLQVIVLATHSQEAIIVQVIPKGMAPNVQLFTAFGGVTGKKFSRDGDIGADPESSFYLQPAYCINNKYDITANSFIVNYGEAATPVRPLDQQDQTGQAAQSGQTVSKKLEGIFPATITLHTASANRQQSPLILDQSVTTDTALVAGKLTLKNADTLYYLVRQPGKETSPLTYKELPAVFKTAEAARKSLAERVQLNTPDPWINTLGGALSMAADGIWESPTYMHGAIAWRMRLPAWRGAYTADLLGWHDRAKTHFSSYALSQVADPLTGPVVADTALHLARQQEKMGTAMFSSGYICRNPNGDLRPHHYDMNLVFIDQLLSHFRWTGDTAYIKQMWPVIERHLAWEKRNFDADGDGLYDAYCCIWASDALQYSGGGVTHASAYNYRANKMAAVLATIAGVNPAPYQKEATLIEQSLDKQLWLPKEGWYAEYKDALGLQLVHPAAALWTIYHAIDEGVPDAFQAWQSLRYIDTKIPHIPVQAKGIADNNLYVLSTTNWQPYTWSINNVALAENLHTTLAYWQGHRAEDAYRLWKSALIESMYLGASPGNFQQLSYYDAIRGELYRDFADPVGMAARTLVEGLFGIQPDALLDTLTIQPGLPAHWNYASLQVPDVQFDFKRDEAKDQYTILPAFSHGMNLKLLVKARRTGTPVVTVNGKAANWKAVQTAVGGPLLEITIPKQEKYSITISWKGAAPQSITSDSSYATAQTLSLTGGAAFIKEVYDPQAVLDKTTISNNRLQAVIRATAGDKTIFIRVQQGSFNWWQPLCFAIKPAVEIIAAARQDSTGIYFTLYNHQAAVKGTLVVNPGPRVIRMQVEVPAKAFSPLVHIPAQYLITGSNEVQFEWAGNNKVSTTILNWNIPAIGIAFEKIDLSAYLNAKLTQVFNQVYAAPRPAVPTLQLPTQGIGNWCYPLVQPVIDDSGLRQRAGNSNEINLDQHIPFATPGDSNTNNILFTSQWNNYHPTATIALSGRASHAYLIMAGTTNPMQSRMVNGEISINYADGTADTLQLKNPQNWWPVEQDYYTDGYAFTTDAPTPLRVYLKSGLIATSAAEYSSIKGFSNRAIEGGAATILDMPVNAGKELKSISIHALCNDVVIGLMSLTLVRN
jgi:hypothetical protein